MGFFTGALALGKTIFGSSVGKMVGTALIGRALQPKPQPAVLRYAEQTETNDANLEVMRQKAEEAGFNPLTVLRSGGINAYATRKTNVPSYAPQLSKGPSYLAIAAGAAAQSYFNRPTEEQKVAQALKIAQQYADLDYTRAMTAGARNAGRGVSMNEPEKVKSNYVEQDAAPPTIEFAINDKGDFVADKVKSPYVPYVSKDGTITNLWFEDDISEALKVPLVELGAFDKKRDAKYRKLIETSDAYWDGGIFKRGPNSVMYPYYKPPLVEPDLTGKMPAGALFDRYMDGLKKAGKWPIQ